MLTDGLEWCELLVAYCDVCIRLSFWRHPFTAEHPLVRKWWSDTFPQICWRNKLILILADLKLKKFSANINFWVYYSFKWLFGEFIPKYCLIVTAFLVSVTEEILTVHDYMLITICIYHATDLNTLGLFCVWVRWADRNRWTPLSWIYLQNPLSSRNSRLLPVLITVVFLHDRGGIFVKFHNRFPHGSLFPQLQSVALDHMWSLCCSSLWLCSCFILHCSYGLVINATCNIF